MGLTTEEGVVFHFVGARRFRPASKHGLPFVAFTRSENFAMATSKNLPPWEDFVRGQDSDMLRMRKEFTHWLEKLHRKTMQKHSRFQTAEEEKMALKNFQAQTTASKEKKRPLLACPCCDAWKLRNSPMQSSVDMPSRRRSLYPLSSSALGELGRLRFQTAEEEQMAHDNFQAQTTASKEKKTPAARVPLL